MNANELLFWLRGMVEAVGGDDPAPSMWRSVATEVLRAQPVKAEIIPVEVVNPIGASGVRTHDCGGCGGKK